jgi:hypothetical protein
MICRSRAKSSVIRVRGHICRSCLWGARFSIKAPMPSSESWTSMFATIILLALSLASASGFSRRALKARWRICPLQRQVLHDANAILSQGRTLRPSHAKIWAGSGAPVAAKLLRGSKNGRSTTVAVVSPEWVMTCRLVPSSAASIATIPRAIFFFRRGE